MRRKLAVIFLAVALFSSMAAAASDNAANYSADEQLMEDVAREANELARLFVRRMRETNDVALVMPELFADDFLDRQLSAPESEPFIFINRSLARSLTRDELLRYYVANVNFRHLNDLYLSGRFPADDPPEAERAYPPALARLIARVDADFEKIERAEEGSPAEEAQAVARLRASLDVLEEANRLLRAEVEGRKLAQSALYRKAVAEWGERFQHFKPWADSCEEGCYGLPAGARLIIVNVPSFQLKVAPTPAGAKIVSALPYFD